jgi:hypothetical protein
MSKLGHLVTAENYWRTYGTRTAIPSPRLCVPRLGPLRRELSVESESQVLVRLAPLGSKVAVAVSSLDGSAWAGVRETRVLASPAKINESSSSVSVKARATATADTAESGLGLAIERQFVDGHGKGRSLQQASVGSSFIVWLPDPGGIHRYDSG